MTLLCFTPEGSLFKATEIEDLAEFLANFVKDARLLLERDNIDPNQLISELTNNGKFVCPVMSLYIVNNLDQRVKSQIQRRLAG